MNYGPIKRRAGYKCIYDERGAIAIEAPFAFFLLLVLIYFALDLGTLLLNKGKVERITHSLASIIRERTALYNGSNTLTNQEVEDLATIGSRMLRETFNGADFSLKVEATYFIYDDHNNIIIDDAIRYVIDPENSGLPEEILPLSFSYSTDGYCQAKKPLSKEQLLNLTLESHRSNWQLVPVYQVTSCVIRHDPNVFSAFVAQNIPAVNKIVVTNVVMPR